MATMSAWCIMGTVMADFFNALLQFGFLQSAVLAAVLASIGCGFIGTFVVVKRISFIAGGIAHSVLAGIGAAVYFGFAPLLGALLAAVAAALLVGLIRIYGKQQEDTLIAAMWAVGMAIGVVLISKSPGYQADLSSYLFGNILLIEKSSLWIMFVLDIILLIIISSYYRQFLAVTFDEEFARLRGVPVTFFYLLLLVMVAITVVLLVQIVGLILVLALLTLPAAIAAHHVHSLGRMMLVSSIIGVSVSLLGLALSFGPDLPSGPTIILLTAAVYLASLVFSHLRQKRQGRLATASQYPAGERHG